MEASKVWTHLKVGNKTVQNRIAMAPMTRGRSDRESGVPSLIKADYYSARSDCGLIISEGVNISKAARGWLDAPGIWNDEQVEVWKKVIKQVKESNNESVVYCQLWHTGRASHEDLQDGDQPVSASAIAINPDIAQSRTVNGKVPYPLPRALTVDQIHQTVQDFKTAAKNAIDAGFDGVEVHGANGYLVNQFLDARSNIRDDEYGASPENRFRIVDEILKGITEVIPSSQVAIRLSPNGIFNDMGSDSFREDFTYYFTQLNTYNLAYLHVMDGLGFGFHSRGEPFTLKQIKELYHGVLIGNCGYDFQASEKFIEEGDADLMALGRPFLANPDLISRLKNGWPLADTLPMSLWYDGDDDGYTNLPTYNPST